MSVNYHGRCTKSLDDINDKIRTVLSLPGLIALDLGEAIMKCGRVSWSHGSLLTKHQEHCACVTFIYSSDFKMSDNLQTTANAIRLYDHDVVIFLSTWRIHYIWLLDSKKALDYPINSRCRKCRTENTIVVQKKKPWPEWEMVGDWRR